MKSAITLRSVLLWFFVVLILYLAVFYGIEFLRHQKGPWEVQFLTDPSGHPSLVVHQPKLNISSVEILLLGESGGRTNLSEVVAFDRPKQPVPFGKVIYEDLTFLPGVVTFDLFGHEVELLPRVLTVNKREVAWKSDITVELSPTDKLPHPPKPAKGYE